VEENNIKILGARVHNLQNVDLEIPCGKLVVITGLSGSGKSSLAFDTIYAEGQRRYMETLSTYARQFVGTMERPDVDKITGLSPVVAIEQKTTNKNPRSTVGTVTEISDFLRLLYARASRAYSPVTGEEMVHYTDEQIVELILKEFDGRKIAVTAPIVKGRKGHYRELFESLIKKGYLYARIDGEIREFTPGMKLDRYKIHTIDLVIDRMAVGDSLRERLLTSLCEAMRQGKGTMAVYDYETGKMRYYSRHLMCPTTGVAFEDPAPHTFSFNSPKGACPHCNGLGEEAVFDREKILPDPALSLRDGGVEPLGKYRNNMLFAILEMLGRRYDFTLDDPVGTISEEGMNAILYGDSEPLTINLAEFCSTGGNNLVSWEGVAEYIGRTEDEDSARSRKWREQFLVYKKCSVCGGTRLRDEALHCRIVEAVKKPVTVKTRLGWDEESKNIEEIALRLQDVGIAALTIHGRTRAQMYRGEADWTLIGKVKNNPAIRIPIIGNGDIDSGPKAREMFDRYGVDGVMIGRATYGRPWIFREVKHFLETGEVMPQPSVAERVEIAKEHLAKSLEIKGGRVGILEMRRHLSNYFKGMNTILRANNNWSMVSCGVRPAS
jgi:excinuclease ABC A subunit